MSSYAWIITKVNTKDLGADSANEMGVYGPGHATDEQIRMLIEGQGFKFRLLDDDGIWYYHGHIIFTDPTDSPLTPIAGISEHWKNPYVVSGLTGDESADFGPLYDFGTPNAGCTDIQYRCANPNGKGLVWASL